MSVSSKEVYVTSYLWTTDSDKFNDSEKLQGHTNPKTSFGEKKISEWEEKNGIEKYHLDGCKADEQQSIINNQNTHSLLVRA